MDELNNRQMILLTMLVAFVVSVGTGIVTVAMLEEAPPVLTQTVNRVVERTIERVVTGSSTPEKITSQPVTTITKEVTIYAKEDDLIVAAVEKNLPRVAQVYLSTQATSTPPLAVGFVVSRDGVIVVDTKSIADSDGLLRASYQAVVGGTIYVVTPIHHDAIAKTPITLLEVDEPITGVTFDAVGFGRQINPKIAQTVIAVGGGDGSGVFKSSLSRFNTVQGEGTSTPSYIASIDSSPSIPRENVGALVINLDAQAVGIVVNNWLDSSVTIYPASRILDLVSAVSSSSGGQSAKADIVTPQVIAS